MSWSSDLCEAEKIVVTFTNEYHTIIKDLIKTYKVQRVVFFFKYCIDLSLPGLCDIMLTWDGLTLEQMMPTLHFGNSLKIIIKPSYGILKVLWTTIPWLVH